MSDYVESISESELADIQEDIDRLRQVTSPASTVGSARSASPSISECSEVSMFKTPQDKSAYRALSFSSPSTSSSFRLLQSLISDNHRDLGRQLRLLEEILRNATGSIQKILSCVLPPIETNIAEDLPRLPLEEKDGEKKMNDLLKQKEQFNKVVTFLHGLGGTCARDAVFSAMKTLFTDEFASTKSMKGIRRTGQPKKDAFMGTPLFKAVMCAVRRRFREATVSEVMEMTGNWLKDAPARERKRQKRKEDREKALREYEEDGTEVESVNLD
ncbi:uncharacterized protein LOC117642014 [Thrips palmi]|uniref:Uncharacterized protein LOC117642014 n=1 Tax=Thrips palmi TaxID=161013 RepID=A0A6P8ZJN6_THRPL|nr:uncharacterized protein LOC117642014 [Thrips palmi]